MDGWARFNVLVEVAEEERMQYEKGKEECSEKERKLRRILSKFLKLANEIEKGNSSGNCSMGEVKKVDLSIYQKGKKSEREKINSEDTMKKLIPQFPNFEGKHQEKDGSVLFSYGDIFKKSSKRLRDTDQEVMPRAKKVKKANLEGPILPLPEAFKSKIQSLGCSESEITFVFQKELTMTDVNRHQGRLLVPFNRVQNHGFLSVEERDMLEKWKNKATIHAALIDPKLNECQINLTRWDMKKKDTGKATCYYSLLTPWSEVVQKNGLQKGDNLQLWGFRKASELGLALVVV